MKRKYILNPSAGREKAFRLISELKDADVAVTQDFADIERQTKLALKEEYEQIVAVGGDGTLNAVVNGFFERGKAINPDACIAIAPLGTGSDYFRNLSSKNADWRELVDKHEVRHVDLGLVEFLRTHRTRFFINMATTGLGAEVVRRRSQVSPLLPSALAYALPTLTGLFSYKATPVRVVIDDEEQELSLLAGFFAKGTYAGSGMKLGGKVELDDGLLDITLIKGMGLHKSLSRLAKLYSGNFEGDPHILKTTAKKIEIYSQAALLIECDGDVAGSTDVRLTVQAKAIPICFPKRKAGSSRAKKRS